ncbi:thiamine-phosphate kinase [Janibacter sp. Y6]|uniref:thiamine-phosphate kinase n=1 Tax=Janibacter sp. Y6 TaxID=2913552 RepID=UPI0034A4705B
MDHPTLRLADLDEEAVLARLLPVLLHDEAPGVPVGPGDDAAVVEAPSGSVVATTDSMVLGVDWRDDWSSPQDVGHKLVVQNVADVAVMGARPTGLLLALSADPATPVEWVLGLAEGVAAAARESATPVLGGDLSGAAAGSVVLAMTVLGDLGGRAPVRRSGARVGDVVAVCGTLGRSGAGLRLYLDAELAAAADRQAPEAAHRLRSSHRRPHCPWQSGAEAARAGASAMLDVSDGLVRDAGRLARASGVSVDLDGAALRAETHGDLLDVLGAEAALREVLGGGEEHALLACFADASRLPTTGAPWRVVGRVVERSRAPVLLDGVPHEVAGWDHFAG